MDHRSGIMNRRSFIGTTARAATTIPFLSIPSWLRNVRMGIVVHSYAFRWNSKIESVKYPGFNDATDLLEHCHRIGAGGVQVIVRDWAPDFVKKVRTKREKLDLFLEGSAGLPKNSSDLQRFEKDIAAAREAGASVVRTVCLNGRRYENLATLPAFQEFAKNSMESLELAEPVMRRHKVRLAIENHKDWRAQELVDILKKLDSEWVGATVDFGNNIALMEDPSTVVKALAPYAFSTHVKDMGVSEYESGFLLSEVPLGRGILDLEEMFTVCRNHRKSVNFNLEMITRDPLKVPCLSNDFWATFPGVGANELASTLRLVRQNPSKAGLPVVSSLAPEERLAAEEENVVASLAYGRLHLGLE